MIILRAKKKKQFTKARSQDLRACDGEVEGDLKTSGTGIREACNYHLGGGVVTLVRLGVTGVVALYAHKSLCERYKVESGVG